MERARNVFETRIIQGLENLGGFGGVADRLNMLQPLPRRSRLPAEGHPAVSRRSRRPSVKAFAQRAARAGGARRRPRRARRAGSRRASADAESRRGAARHRAPSRSTPTSHGGRRRRRPAEAKRCRCRRRCRSSCPNGLTVLVNERRGLPIVSASLVVKTGSGANPADKPGLANFTAAMLDEGTATRNALQIADEVAQLGASLNTSSTMDASQVTCRVAAAELRCAARR